VGVYDFDVLRALLASPLGFLIGLALGALGGGGSVLAVPALVYVAGQTPQEATTTSLLVVGAAALAGMARHHRAGRVRTATGLVFGLAGIGGAVAGTAVNARLNPDVLLLAFSGVVVLAAWRMVTGCPTCTRVGEDLAVGTSGGLSTGTRLDLSAGTVMRVLAAGTAVGFFTGLFGVGGGFLVVPALTLLLRFPMPDAIGTSLLVIATNSGVALLARVGGVGAGTETVGIAWAVALPFAAASLLGVVAGTEIAARLPARKLLNYFAALLVCVALYTAARSLAAL
jgi:uncharacterized membrane protein YfcA